MQPYTHEIFRDIVRDGLLVDNGMPAWNDVLTDSDIDSIHAFLLSEQRRISARELEHEPKVRARAGQS